MIRRAYKKTISGLLIAATVMLTLSGCKYDSFDEYLQALGMKDADEEVSSSVASSSLTSFDLQAQNDNLSHSSDGASSASISSSTDEGSEAYSGPKADSDLSSYYKSADDEADEAIKKAREEIGLTDSTISTKMQEQKGLYAFDRLTEQGKILYVEILTILENEASDVVVSTTSDEAVELVFDYVCTDHPEIFYVDGYSYTNYTVDNVITRISFSGNYTYDIKEVERRKKLINEYVNTCIAGAPSTEDDYYVIKYVYEYIIENTDYDLSAEDNQNICSVFIGHKSVCNGYAKATQYILNKLGIKCTLVVGKCNTKNSKGVRHAWNVVLCNDAYYYVDTTWGDSSYQTSAGESADATKLPKINYDYLNVTSEEIQGNHFISDLIDMPYCSSLKDNYYVREDEYFTSAESSLIAELFKRRYEDGSDNVTIKCSSKEVYDAIFDEMVTSRKVFDYLQGDNSVVSYTTFAETRTLIFWIK